MKKGFIVGILSTNMTKACDSVFHPPMIAKSKAYGVCGNSTKLLNSHFTDGYNRVKLCPIVSSWVKVTRGCPQGPAFGPLLWNVFQKDNLQHYYKHNMYADDHQLFHRDVNMENVQNNLTSNTKEAST